MATTAVGIASRVAIAAPPARRWYIDVWVQMVLRKPLGTLGAVIVLVMLTAAVLADVIAPYAYAETSLRERFVAMNARHWLGTDQLGRDLLTRLIYGARPCRAPPPSASRSALANTVGIAASASPAARNPSLPGSGRRSDRAASSPQRA